MSPFLRISWWVATCLALMGAALSLRAQDTNPAVDMPPASVPAPSTNFPDHPEETSPSQTSIAPSPSPQEAVPSSPPPDNTESVPLVSSAPEVESLAAHLLVVYNQNDPDSKALADYYALRRNIPPERVLPIFCSGSEEISRDDFEKTIRQPILFYLLQKGWMVRKSSPTQLGTRVLNLLVAIHNDIWAIVLMRGVPLKIASDSTDDDVMENEQFFKDNGASIDPGTLGMFKTNAAAVDSELALLPVFGLPRGGFVPNGFFDPKMTGIRRVGSQLAKSIVLVSRLDGPTPEQVKRMIDDSLYAEENRLAGLAVIDTRGITDPKSGFFGGDVWLRNARNLLIHDGWVVQFDDKPEVLPSTVPLNQVALYMGWYSGQAEGPWVTAPNRFVRGAIAYHLHSYSASTIRSETDNWVGPLIAHGATATMGTVYEPLLGWTPHEDIFTKHLLDGNYFVEAAYASQMGLSWMTTVVGDPLYRPFRRPLESAVAAAASPHTNHDDWLFLQLMRREIAARTIETTPESFQQSIEIPSAGPVAEEGLGDLLSMLNNSPPSYTADHAYKKAEDGFVLPIDRIRVGVKLSNYYLSHNQSIRGEAELDRLRQLFPVDAARFGLAPPPPATDTAPLAVKQSSMSVKKSGQPVPAMSAPPKPPGPAMPPLPNQVQSK